jgi:hypothetical protein
MSTRDALLKEQEREREIMQGASIETIICGRAYTWLEPSARDRRLMIGDIGAIQISAQGRDMQAKGVMMALNFLVDWHPEIRKDQDAIDQKIFTATKETAPPIMKEIADAYTKVVEMIQRPFVKTNVKEETLIPTQ